MKSAMGTRRFLQPLCVLVPLLLPFFLAGCCSDPVNGGRYFCFGEISDEEEASIGAEFSPSFVAQNGGEYPDPELQSYLSSIVLDKLAKRSQRAQLPWTFTILNTSELNAFALPGGKVFVTRGLLNIVQSEAQFAHLMGHEIGHICHRHAMRGQGRAAIVSILVGAVEMAEQALPTRGPDEPLWIASAAGGAGTLTALKFSRDQELESDERGADYALAAGYDPREGTKTFATFLALKDKAEQGKGAGLVGALFSSHPLDSERIIKLEKYISEHYPELGKSGAPLTIASPRFTELFAGIKAAQPYYEKNDQALTLIARAREEKNQRFLDDAETLARECAAKYPEHAAFQVTLGLIAAGRNSPGDALRFLDRAIGLDANSFDARISRGVVLVKQKKLNEAAAELQHAMSLFPSSPVPNFFLGQVYEQSGKRGSAVAEYERAIAKSPRGSDIRSAARARINQL